MQSGLEGMMHKAYLTGTNVLAKWYANPGTKGKMIWIAYSKSFHCVLYAKRNNYIDPVLKDP